MHISLTCAACGQGHDVDRLQNLCTACSKPLLAGYDLESLRGHFTAELVRQRPVRSMWRFHEVLPVNGPGEAVSLGEGSTPLIRCRRRGNFEPFEHLYVKDEALNPTGSFKARGISAAITRAVALGATAVALPSAGNAAGAAAHYANRAGIECHLFMPEDTPAANITESLVAGARVVLVKGLISDCGQRVREGSEHFGWFDLSTLKEPFRIEGKKTMGYELALDLADAHGGEASKRKGCEPGPGSGPVSGLGRLQLPDVIFYPTGGGTGLIGMWKAFDEMEKLGWIGSERPRMVVVQAEGCCPIVRAFESGAEQAESFPNASTVASGLRVPDAVGDFLMLRVLRESGGTAVAINDEELLAGVGEFCCQQGIYLCPESGAVWAAARRLLESGWLSPSERIVLFNTGSGLKYNHLFPLEGERRMKERSSA